MSKQSAYSLIQQLHHQAVVLAKNFRKLEIELLEILEKLDQHKVYRSFGYPSLFQYVVKELMLTDDVAYALILVSRKGREIPQFKKAIQKQEISISKARRLTSVIENKNKDHWIELAKTLTKRELEREVAAAKPSTAIPEMAQYVPPDQGHGESAHIRKFEVQYPEPEAKSLKSIRIQLQLGLSEGLMMSFRRAQDLVSSKLKGSASLEMTLERLLCDYIERNCPLERAKRQAMRGKLPLPGGVGNSDFDEANANNGKPISQKMTRRNSLTAARKHQVRIRDNYRCTFRLPNGEICFNTRHLEIHHVIPLSQGGNHDLKNLKLICSEHHKLIHDGAIHKEKEK